MPIQEPIRRSMQLPYSAFVTAFLQTDIYFYYRWCIYVRGRELHVSSCALMICVRNHAILVCYKGKTPLFDLIGCCSYFVSERQIFESFLLRTLRRTLFFALLSALIKQHDWWQTADCISCFLQLCLFLLQRHTNAHQRHAIVVQWLACPWETLRGAICARQPKSSN